MWISGHFRRAFATGSPVCIPYFFAGIDLASTTPCLDFRSPPMMAGMVLISSVAPLFNCSTAVQLRYAELTSIWNMIRDIGFPPLPPDPRISSFIVSGPPQMSINTLKKGRRLCKAPPLCVSFLDIADYYTAVSPSFTLAVSFPSWSSMRIVSPLPTLPSSISLAAVVSTFFCRYRFSGLAPYMGS